MPRSLRVDQTFIYIVKDAVYRSGFMNQRQLAESLGIALSTVSNFLNGKPVDLALFEEICRKLSLDAQQIAALPVRPNIVTLPATYSRAGHLQQDSQHQTHLAQSQPAVMDSDQPFGNTPIAFSPDGKWLAARTPNGTIQIWDWRSGKCLNTLQASGQ